MALVTGVRSAGKRSRAPGAAVLAAFAILTAFAMPPVANALLRSLEVPVLTRMREGITYDAAIVLTGVMDGNPSIDFGESAYNTSVDRVLIVLDLLRSGRVRKVLVSGTSWAPAPGEGESEARRIAHDLERWGIDRSRIVVEEQSRTTRENAVDSAAIVAKEGWKAVLLVTSAAHMQRARGCFRAVGLDVDTRATDFESYDPTRRRVAFFPTVTALDTSAGALHELAGRVVYRLRGWTRE